jgi:hypothetical protein
MDMPFKNLTLIRTAIVASAILLGSMGVAYSHGGHGGGHHGGHHRAHGHHAGHHAGYHHGGRGYRHGYGRRGYGYGHRGYGWRSGYWRTGVAYPAGCGWVGGHYNRNGWWVPGRRVCY